MLAVEDDYLCESILLGRDVLCQKGQRLIIDNDDCWLEQQTNINTGNTLTKTDINAVHSLVSRHRECFATNVSELGKCVMTEMTIRLTTDTPVATKPYRIPFAKWQKVDEIVHELLTNEIIRPSDSPYASPVVLVEKKNGENRMCVDYCRLNSITVKQSSPMPILEEQFAQLAGNSLFTTLLFTIYEWVIIRSVCLKRHVSSLHL